MLACSLIFFVLDSISGGPDVPRIHGSSQNRHTQLHDATRCVNLPDAEG